MRNQMARELYQNGAYKPKREKSKKSYSRKVKHKQSSKLGTSDSPYSDGLSKEYKMNFYEFMTEIENASIEYIEKHFTPVKSDDVGLDRRCGMLYIKSDGENVIAVRDDYVSYLEYYGGFEYIPIECRYRIGNYTFYISDTDGDEASRIEEVCERFHLMQDA